MILQGCKAFTVVCELNQSCMDLLVKISFICVMLSHFLCLHVLFFPQVSVVVTRSLSGMCVVSSRGLYKHQCERTTSEHKSTNQSDISEEQNSGTS